MWSHLLVLVCALLLPAQALAGAKEKVAALAPSGLVLVMDEKGNELVFQNADNPFVPASVTKIVTAWLAMEVLRRRLDETYPPHWCRSSSGSLARVTVPSRAS